MSEGTKASDINDEGESSEPSNQQQLLSQEEAEVRVAPAETCKGPAKMSPKKAPWLLSRCSAFIHAVSPLEICPTLTWLHILVTRIEVAAMIGALVYVIVSLPWAESVRSSLLQLFVLETLAWAFGTVAGLIRLPPLLGMLLAGLLLRNVGYFEAQGMFLQFVSTLRVVAMTVILLKAGLGLDPAALRRLSMAVLRLAVCPCVAEAVTVGIVAHFLLNFPWLWGLLLGFVLGAVSPAVVVPSLLDLKSRGFGEDKGISTLVIAASSLDDILAISFFGVFLTTIFSEGSLLKQVFHGPLEVILGLLWGVLTGGIAIYIPHRDDNFVVNGRLLMVGVSGLLAVLGGQLIGYAGAGPLACITCAFVACCGWRAISKNNSSERVAERVSDIWSFVQPLLFGLIGTEINLSALDGRTVAFGIIVLFTGLTVRILISACAVQGAGLSLKETMFVAVAWFPKATVQAAIGPVALDLARGLRDDCNCDAPGKLQMAHDVLTIAVLSILVTAPLGAIGILWSGPRLLSRSETNDSLAPNPTSVEDTEGRRTEDVV